MRLIYFKLYAESKNEYIFKMEGVLGNKKVYFSFN